MQTDNAVRKFTNKHTSDILIVSIGALAIVLFLSISFAWYDATNVPLPNRSIHRTDRSAKAEELIAQARCWSNQPSVLASSNVPINFALSSLGLNAVVSPDANNGMWRYTSEGWKDISTMVNQPQPTEQFLESVHPWIWTALMVFGAMMLLVMASSEKDVRQLLGKPEPDTTKKNR